ncbi:MAG: transporter substrate-binding domain-containing protein [Armatimonadota bacterium]|nr:transporter substrate-binding domain-containing protein [Armatimonadota bacterium]MDR7402056.1 transporter substrate-binding domain-containing protein [Armatimonadota bacterium]MDR7403989.1 transporter substrate-binding domain-containing protein [Armatimonadota bacterium]MDR7437118.1 transporter substrate-binding domain-containing protein [Armatimonadota bacterium]MDR7472463.1 transporter substrate-binding domain-containing protein [Armatimonadota bacterium]
MRRGVAYLLAVALTVAAVSYTALAQPRTRVDMVRARGKLICGVSGATPGFSFPDPVSGRMVGFDADFCWAVAAFVDVPDVEFVNLTSANRIPAVVSGAVDVVFRTTTVTISRDDQVDFGPVTFYDGQRLLVRAASRIAGLDDLNGARICVHSGTTSERNITDQMRQRGFRFQLITFAEAKQAFDGLVAGRCDVFTTDASQLTAFRSTAPNPADFKIVGKEFSDEPLAPMYQENDSKWADVVNWTVWGVILGEELGITQAVARDAARLAELSGRDPVAKNFLEAKGGAMLRVLRLVGNYGEIYDRYFGPRQKTAITRAGTRNDLASRGGAMTSRPFR